MGSQFKRQLSMNIKLAFKGTCISGTKTTYEAVFLGLVYSFSHLKIFPLLHFLLQFRVFP